MTITVPLFFLFTSVLWQSCHAAIWETEEAYVFDGSVQETEDVSTYDSCTDSAGVKGFCVPKIKCDKVLRSVDLQSSPEILWGMERYLNDTPATYCQSGAHPVKLVHVCCTSLTPSNMVKSVTLKEYENQRNDNFTSIKDGLMNEIPPANSSTELDGKILRGKEAAKGEFPYIVSLFYQGKHICGGSLLDSNWVLSAAHCFGQNVNIYDLVVKVGDHDVTKTADAKHQDIRVSNVYVHRGFHSNPKQFRDDIALIKLQTAVVAAPNIRTVTLHDPSAPDAPPADIDRKLAEATVSGWGQFSCIEDHCPTSAVLRKAVVPLITQEQCSQKYRGTNAPPITAGMVCAGGYNAADACRGDSGGPLVVNYNGKVYQIGLTSWGIGCGQYPGVYTRVSKYLEWIRKHKVSGNRGHGTQW